MPLVCALASIALAASPAITAPTAGELECSLDVAFSGTITTCPVLTTCTVGIAVGSIDSAATVSGTSWSGGVTLLDAGTYSAVVTETETPTLGSVTTSTADVTFQVETEAPPVTVTEPASGGQVYVTEQPLIAGSSRPDAGVSISIATLTSTVVGTAGVLVGADAGWAAAIDIAPAGNGAYLVTTQGSSNDACHYTGPTSQRAIVIDTTPAAIIAPDAGSTLNTTAVLLEGTSARGAAVVVGVNGVDTTLSVDDAGAWSLSTTLDAGANSITAQAQDATGARSAQATSTISVALTTITSPTPDEDVLSPVTIAGTADPSTTVDLSVTIEDGGHTGAVVSVDGTGAWSYGLALVAGSHLVQATDVDGTGFVGSTASVTFTVVTTSPSSSSLSSSSSTSSSSSASSSSASSSSSSSSPSSSAAGGSGASSIGSSASGTSSGSVGAAASGSSSMASSGGGSTSHSFSSSSGGESATASTGIGTGASGSTGHGSTGLSASSSSGTGASSSTPSGGSSGSTRSPGASAASSTGGSSGASSHPLSLYRGCGCSSDGDPLTEAALALALLGLGSRRRRRG